MCDLTCVENLSQSTIESATIQVQEKRSVFAFCPPVIACSYPLHSASMSPSLPPPRATWVATHDSRISRDASLSGRINFDCLCFRVVFETRPAASRVDPCAKRRPRKADPIDGPTNWPNAGNETKKKCIWRQSREGIARRGNTTRPRGRVPADVPIGKHLAFGLAFRMAHAIHRSSSSAQFLFRYGALGRQPAVGSRAVATAAACRQVGADDV
jgi:hypothetical protein